MYFKYNILQTVEIVQIVNIVDSLDVTLKCLQSQLSYDVLNPARVSL